MSEDLFRKLAQRLDATPNSFPATESGVELRLLAEIFTPEEAVLACMMTLNPESPHELSSRSGIAPEEAQRLLEGMASRGLVFAVKQEDHLTYGLMPFIVGIYESHLPRMNVEFAELFEQYYQETEGLTKIVRSPSVHRVIPIEEAIPFDMEIFPYERASELVEKAQSWGVRDCICRVQQHLIGHDCGHPVEVCLVFAPVKGAFDRSEVDHPLSKEEALGILKKAKDAGLIHSTSNRRDGNNYICNCCTCSCGVLRGVAEFGNLTAVAHSDFRSSVNTDLCIGCGECVEQCQFGALSVPEDVCVVDNNRCMGCGLCITVCPTDALHLERLPFDESSSIPATLQEWETQRLHANGITHSNGV